MRLLAVLLVVGLALPHSPFLAAAVAQAEVSSVAGTATSSTGEILTNATVQLRELANGTIAGTTTSSSTGAFSFTVVNPGEYVVEVLNAAGEVVGTSASIAVNAGATITGVTVTAMAAKAITAAAIGAGLGAASIVAITSAAAAAGVVGLAVTGQQQAASPSR